MDQHRIKSANEGLRFGPSKRIDSHGKTGRSQRSRSILQGRKLTCHQIHKVLFDLQKHPTILRVDVGFARKEVPKQNFRNNDQLNQQKSRQHNLVSLSTNFPHGCSWLSPSWKFRGTESFERKDTKRAPPILFCNCKIQTSKFLSYAKWLDCWETLNYWAMDSWYG